MQYVFVHVISLAFIGIHIHFSTRTFGDATATLIAGVNRADERVCFCNAKYCCVLYLQNVPINYVQLLQFCSFVLNCKRQDYITVDMRDESRTTHRWTEFKARCVRLFKPLKVKGSKGPTGDCVCPVREQSQYSISNILVVMNEKGCVTFVSK